MRRIFATKCAGNAAKCDGGDFPYGTSNSKFKNPLFGRKFVNNLFIDK